MDEVLSEVPVEAQLLLAGLWTIADREGRLEDRPKRIKAQVFPYRDVDVERMLHTLHAVGRIRRYRSGGMACIQVADWARDQRPHVKEAASVIPSPLHENTEHLPSTYPAPTQHRRVPGEFPASSGARTLGSGIWDPFMGSGIQATASQETADAVPMADDIPQAADEDVQEADTRPALVLSPPAEKPEALQAAWNQHAHPSLPRWQGMSEKRRRSAAARLRERPLEAWVAVIQRLSASPFCRGEEKGSGWRASPDWLLQPDVADKVLEGKYDRQAAPERHLGIAPPPGAPTAEDRRRAHQEYLAREAAKKAGGAP